MNRVIELSPAISGVKDFVKFAASHAAEASTEHRIVIKQRAGLISDSLKAYVFYYCYLFIVCCRVQIKMFGALFLFVPSNVVNSLISLRFYSYSITILYTINI
jgi:hypothetical protein